MSYLIKDEEILSVFQNHKATLKVLDEDTQTLEWKKPGTRNYQIDYVFHKNMLLIHGDLGEASFSLTWNPKWDDDKGWLIGIDYLFEKLSAISGGKYNWSKDAAVKDLKYFYEEIFEELSKEEFEQLHNDVINEINTCDDYFIAANISNNELVDSKLLEQYIAVLNAAIISDNQEEYVYNIQHNTNFEDFNDFWEWGYNCGRRMTSKINYYLAGLQMASKQLKENQIEEKKKSS